ncbi:MAG TPA: hypothetical protein PKV72_06135, partial [Candidatus Peribacteria bacterium]|nr:hypothetical protein [Candidatus Peribacteria bacterium]
CIESLTVNGENVPEAAFCGDAHVVDFAAFLKSDRRNVLVANIKNNGGPVGLIIGPGKLSLLPFSMVSAVLITLGMVLASTWNLVSICIGLRRKHGHPAAIRADVRGKTGQLLRLPLLETLVPA